MPPPQLPRDAPVLDVVQPLVVSVHPVFRVKLDLATCHAFQRLLGDAFSPVAGFAHRDEPLIGQHGLDHHMSTVTARYFEFVLLGLLEKARSFEVGNDLFASRKALQAS